MSKPIVLIGNGGHASVITETLHLLDREILGFTAPIKESNRYGVKYLGDDVSILDYSPSEIELVLCIGTVNVNSIRKQLFRRFKNQGYQFSTIIHPSCVVSHTVTFGEGVQIMAGAILQSNTRVSDNSIINTGTLIDHDCRIGKHVHIAPGCKLSGGIKIESDCHIGTGSTIIQGIWIGRSTLVGAGSVVTRNVGNYKKVIGVPAKEV